MATYKLMQDIEAEDKILGPLTLRQFIFALVTAFLFYICFLCATKGYILLMPLFLVPGLLTGFFAFPFGRDQPTEVWALAKIRYYFKPRKRIWDQSGIKELVTINVPKKIERIYTNGLSQTEVQSRLKALANTIDSRGWAVKNVNLNTYTPNSLTTDATSDRLIDMNNVPQAVPDSPVHASDDILDAQNNPIAQQFDAMISQSNQTHRQRIVSQLNSDQTQPAASSDAWFMGGGAPAAAQSALTAEEELLAKSRADREAREVTYGHMRTLRRPGASPAPSSTPAPTYAAQSLNSAVASDDSAMPSQPDPAILSLANNDDLNVSTLAREAQKAKEQEGGKDEVVVSLR